MQNTGKYELMRMLLLQSHVPICLKFLFIYGDCTMLFILKLWYTKRLSFPICIKAQIDLTPGNLTVIITLSLFQVKKVMQIEVEKTTVFVKENG